MKARRVALQRMRVGGRREVMGFAGGGGDNFRRVSATLALNGRELGRAVPWGRRRDVGVPRVAHEERGMCQWFCEFMYLNSYVPSRCVWYMRKEGFRRFGPHECS